MVKQISYKRKCSVCAKEFITVYSRHNICSHTCRKEATRERSRRIMRLKRINPLACQPCIVCGYNETTDLHHEGKKTYILCPNHHALITRGIKTIKEIAQNKYLKPYNIPKKSTELFVFTK